VRCRTWAKVNTEHMKWCMNAWNEAWLKQSWLATKHTYKECTNIFLGTDIYPCLLKRPGGKLFVEPERAEHANKSSIKNILKSMHEQRKGPSTNSGESRVYRDKKQQSSGLYLDVVGKMFCRWNLPVCDSHNLQRSVSGGEAHPWMLSGDHSPGELQTVICAFRTARPTDAGWRPVGCACLRRQRKLRRPTFFSFGDVHILNSSRLVGNSNDFWIRGLMPILKGCRYPFG
jgi:hypothetical protein